VAPPETPNACDVCPGYPDLLDADGDAVPDGCDQCSGFDDIDADGDGIPDACVESDPSEAWSPDDIPPAFFCGCQSLPSGPSPLVWLGLLIFIRRRQ
jgi:hypothetical protein